MAIVIRKDNSARIKKHVRENARRRIQDFAEVMTEKAKELSPYQSGNNRDNIRWEWIGDSTARILTESGYGAFLELGTVKRAATPYMAPAYEFAKEEIGRPPWDKGERL